MVVVMVMVMVEGWGVTICNIIFLIENGHFGTSLKPYTRIESTD